MRVEAAKAVQANETDQVELLYRDIAILRGELDALRDWKANTLGELENLQELAVSNRDSYIDAKLNMARDSKRNYEFEHKAAARASESQIWVNRLEEVLLKIK